MQNLRSLLCGEKREQELQENQTNSVTFVVLSAEEYLLDFNPGKTSIFNLIYFNAILILIISSDKAKFLNITRIFLETATAITTYYSIFT